MWFFNKKSDRQIAMEDIAEYGSIENPNKVQANILRLAKQSIANLDDTDRLNKETEELEELMRVLV